MGVTNIQFWADTLEVTRLPDITQDVALLESRSIAAATLLSTTIQTTGDRDDANAAAVAAVAANSTVAIENAAYALARLNDVSLATINYVNSTNAALRADLTQQVITAKAAIQADLGTQMTGEIAVISPDLAAQISAGNAVVAASQADITNKLVDFDTATTSILNSVLPQFDALQGTISEKVEVVSNRFDLLLTGFQEDDLMTALDVVTAMAATNASTVAVRMATGMVSKNPVFSSWVDTGPANVTIGVTGTSAFSKITPSSRYFNTLQLTGSDLAYNGPYVQLNTSTHVLDCVPSPQRVLVRAEVELVSGSLSGGACLMANWGNGSGGVAASAGKLLSNFMTTEVGKLQVIEWYVERPSSFVAGTLPQFALSLYAMSNLLGATRAACVLRVHRLDFAVVTANSMASMTMGAAIGLDVLQSSMFAMRVIAGDAEGSFELVAMSDPVEGTASVAKLSAKHFDIKASSVRISDSSNVYLDFDMLDPLFYSSSDSAAFSFIGTTTASLGQKFLNIAANATTRSVDTGWFGVEPNTEYLVSGAAFLSSTAAGQGTATLTIETGLIDGVGAVSVVTSTVVQARTDLNYAGLLTAISLLTGATVRRARFKLTRAAGGSGAARAGGFKVQKKSGSSLIVDGSITATKLIQTEALITNTAQIADLTVARIHIGVGSVTEFSEVWTSISHNGLSTYGTAELMWTEEFTVGADVPEKMILTAYVDSISRSTSSMAVGQLNLGYGQIIDRKRGTEFTMLRSGFSTLWEYITDGTRMSRVFAAEGMFEQYAILHKGTDFIAGDVIRIGYYYQRKRVSGTATEGSMAASRVGYTLEEFYK